MVRVHAPSRLHFGLFCLPDARGEPRLWKAFDGNGLPARHFGGVGLMTSEPGIVVAIERSDTWMSSGPLAQRALAYAQQWARLENEPGAFRIAIESAPLEHVGLGTGTQLALAIGTALARLTERNADPLHLARILGRGLRSGLGIHGFARGGFLAEGGKTRTDQIAPLLLHHPWPADWHILLVQPPGESGLSGPDEKRGFARLQASCEADVNRLARIALLGMWPALLEKDLATFGAATHEFNRRVGEMFQPAQGGIYASPLIAEWVEKLTKLGLVGVGQSSWGPTLFGFADADKRAWIERTNDFPVTWTTASVGERASPAP